MDNRPRIRIRHLDDELPKVNAGVVIGGVADGADDGEGRAKLQTDLRHGCAFHLNTLYIWQQGQYFVSFLNTIDELVAAGNVAEMQSRIEVELLDGLLAHYTFYTFINKVCHGTSGQSGQVGVAVHINAVEQGKLEARNDRSCVQIVLHQSLG